jgi:radical SAM protein with 4Fe4S-binding SPASM domain
VRAGRTPDAPLHAIVLSISGGEPLISPALFPVLERAKGYGIETAIITNGLLLSGSRLARLASLIDVCAISFDGLSAPTHDRIRGAGMFERTWHNLIALDPPPFRVVLNVTALRSNIDELAKNLPAFVASIPFDVDVDIGSLITEGRGINEASLGLSRPEFRQLLTHVAAQFVQGTWSASAGDRAAPNVMSSGLSGTWKPIPMRRKPNCGYAETLTVYANGDIGTCITPRFIRGNLFSTDAGTLLDTIDHERSLTMVDRLEECSSCVLRHICGGRCHLSQLRAGEAPGQVACPQAYKDSMLRNLAAWGSS